MTVLHFGLAVDFSLTQRALIDRFSARSVESGSMVNLLQCYILSYGVYLIVLVLLLVLLAIQLLLSGRVPFFSSRREESTSSRTPPFLEKYRFVFIAASVPLLENVLMLQHASEFTFDRLKFTVPAALVIAIGFSVASSRARVLIAFFLVGAAIQGWQSYKTDLTKYAGWRDANTSNKQLAAALENQDRDACAVYASNIGVRGYTNLLFHRGIYEWKRPDQVKKLLHSTGACKSIYIEGDVLFPDLPLYTKATVTDVDGTVTVIDAGDVK